MKSKPTSNFTLGERTFEFSPFFKRKEGQMEEKEETRKIVVLHSGGLDSTCLVYYVKSLGMIPLSFSVNYKQRHSVELTLAEKISKTLGLKHFVANLETLGDIGGSSQTDKNIPVPLGHYTDKSMVATVVPNRNMILLALAGAFAIANDCASIAIANHAGDHPIYPDCRPDFIANMQRAFKETWGISLKAPFTFYKKSDIVKLGSSLNVPFVDTWSCYQGNFPKHCGKCGTCVERKEAFTLSGVEDPTLYEDQGENT